MRWARVLTTWLMVMRWAIPEAVHVNIGRCLRLVHLASSPCPCLCLPSYPPSRWRTLFCVIWFWQREWKRLIPSYSEIAQEFLVGCLQGFLNGLIDDFPNPFLDCHQKTFGVRMQNKRPLTPGVSYCVFESNACRSVFRSVRGWTFLISSYLAEPSRFAFMFLEAPLPYCPSLLSRRWRISSPERGGFPLGLPPSPSNIYPQHPRFHCAGRLWPSWSLAVPPGQFREFSRYVGRMANRKASGDDKMPADLFKKAPEAFRKRAWILINIILAGLIDVAFITS